MRDLRRGMAEMWEAGDGRDVGNRDRLGGAEFIGNWTWFTANPLSVTIDSRIPCRARLCQTRIMVRVMSLGVYQ